MAINIPTNITNSLDGYLLDAKNVKGTYVVVNNYSDLANLPNATIVNGSLAYCQNSYSTYSAGIYQFNGSTWVFANLNKTQATYNNLGEIKLGSATQSSQNIETASSIAGRQYPVQVDNNGRASVNVPWTNTTYTNGNGIDLTGTEFSIDNSVVALKSDLSEYNGTATQTTEILNNIVVDNKTYTVTSSRETPVSGGTTLSLVNTGDMYTWNNKQDTLTFDNTPTQNSDNPVKSNGIYLALSDKQDTLTAGNNITIQNNIISAIDNTVLNGVAYREI